MNMLFDDAKNMASKKIIKDISEKENQEFQENFKKIKTIKEKYIIA